MAAGAPQIPLLVLPEDGVVRRSAAVGPVEAAALAAAIDAVTRLAADVADADGTPEKAEAALATAVDQTAVLVAAVRAAVPPVRTAGLVPMVPNHDYFSVRTAALDSGQQLAQVATVVARSLADLRNARMDVNDVVAETLALAAVLATAAPAPAVPAATWPVAELPAGQLLDYLPDGTGLVRWVVAHHAYFILNLYAADAVGQAVGVLADPDPDRSTAPAVSALTEAAGYVRGLTAAMAHSAAIPAEYYREVVRPTMRPPAVPVLLTGRTQPEHRRFRSGVDRLLAACPEPFDRLAERDPDLALARDALLAADLVDIERHTLVADALVGDDRSIVQSGSAADNAVTVLRSMRHLRADRYRPLQRFGDPVPPTGLTAAGEAVR